MLCERVSPQLAQRLHRRQELAHELPLSPQGRLEVAKKPTTHPLGAVGVCGRPMAASATGLTATRPPRGLNSSEKLPWEGVHPSPRTTNSTHSSELPRSLWSTPGVSPNSRVHTPVTSGPPQGPL